MICRSAWTVDGRTTLPCLQSSEIIFDGSTLNNDFDFCRDGLKMEEEDGLLLLLNMAEVLIAFMKRRRSRELIDFMMKRISSSYRSSSRY